MLLFCLVFGLAQAFFTEDFSTFLADNYGDSFRDLLQRFLGQDAMLPWAGSIWSSNVIRKPRRTLRRQVYSDVKSRDFKNDLGEKGSFGGKNSADEEILHDPIVFVHGVSDTAGENMKKLAATFISHGYLEGELYGTTYYNGARGNPIQWAHYSMRCEYVKQIRTLILAVKVYTSRNVDVVAYSLGVPLARKAILGGTCVDTDEELGQPLTKHVDTFVGVAGPNHGVAPRVAGLPIPACILGATAICDPVIGLHSGLCPIESSFLKDVNDEEHYEGAHVFSIYSQADQVVGYKVCNTVTAAIPGEDGHKAYTNLDHDNVLLHCSDVLPVLLQNHSTFLPTPIEQRGAKTRGSKLSDVDVTVSDISISPRNNSGSTSHHIQSRSRTIVNQERPIRGFEQEIPQKQKHLNDIDKSRETVKQSTSSESSSLQLRSPIDAPSLQQNHFTNIVNVLPPSHWGSSPTPHDDQLHRELHEGGQHAEANKPSPGNERGASDTSDFSSISQKSDIIDGKQPENLLVDPEVNKFDTENSRKCCKYDTEETTSATRSEKARSGYYHTKLRFQIQD